MVSILLVLVGLIVFLHGKAIPNCNGGKGHDNITSLYGYRVDHANPYLKMFSGFIQVNKTANGSLFYWLVNSMTTQNAPLLIWLNGGPGASSLTAMFAENGPFRIEPDGKTLAFFNYTWARHYHMLFVDNPINTGFSFCNPGQEVTNEDQMGQNFLTFMEGFYACHPELQHNDLYITGESYAGRYIPFIWKHIHTTYNKQIKGLAIGNGIYDPFIQFYSSPFYAFTNGIIDHEEFIEINASVGECMQAAANAAKTMNIKELNNSANDCLNWTNAVYGVYGGNIFQYDIRENNAGVFDGITANIQSYLGQSQVAVDLHTEGIPWKSSDGTSAPNPVANALNYDIVLNNSASIIPEVLKSGARILFYNGQFDGSVCNNYGNQECLAQFNYKGTWNELHRSPCYIDNLCVGYIKESSDKLLTYFVVSDSGHLVPYNQPDTALKMIYNFVQQKPWN